jgi:hypothetical protein
MNANDISRDLLLLLVCFVTSSCTPTSSQDPDTQNIAGKLQLEKPASSPEGHEPATDSALLSQFAGPWVFELDKTLAAKRAAGAADETIAQLRRIYADESHGPMHPDLTIKRGVAIGAGTLSPEYRFFGMHPHGAKVCGKAWHHEDRFDPGDMSKCYVRLSIVDGDLHLEVNMLEDLPDINDPDLRSTPAVEGDVSTCDADKQNAADWATYVFSRGT